MVENLIRTTTLRGQLSFLDKKYFGVLASLDLEKNLKQKDLTLVQFVLLSSTINENFHAFNAPRLAEIYKTAENKPLDIFHVIEEKESYLKNNDELIFSKKPDSIRNNLNSIIGHVVRSFLVDNDGEILTEKQIKDIAQSNELFPKNPIHCICSAVLYDLYFPKTIEDLKRQIKNNEIFVSVESWYAKWDYLLNKSKEIIERTEATKYLDDYLGQEYKNEKLAFLLLDYFLGGVGITSFPANAPSRFLSIAKEKNSVAELENALKLHDTIHDIFDDVELGDEDFKESLINLHANLNRKLGSRGEN